MKLGDVFTGDDGIVYQTDDYGDVISIGYPDGTSMDVATGSAIGATPVDAQSPAAPPAIPQRDWLDMLTKVLPQAIAGINAYQLSQINLDRARRNLPPLSAARYGPTVGVGLTGDTSKLLMYGALAVGAVFLLTSAKK